MAVDYFHCLHKETGTRFWVNNPSESDLDKALAAGAISCTTNPAYCSKLLTSDTAYLHGVIDAVIQKETHEIERAAMRVYQQVTQRVIDRFRPLYDQSGGTCGFVTMQDDPRQDRDTQATMRGMRENRRLGPNYMAKIPVIAGGLEAIEVCVEENI